MKKLTAFLLSFTMIMSATACSGAKKSKVAKTPETVAISQTTYGTEEIVLDDAYDAAYVSQITPYDDGVCLFYSTADGKTKFIRTDKDFNIIANAELSQSSGSGMSFSVNSDGSFFAVTAETDFEFEYDNNNNITNFDKYYTDARFTFSLTSFDNNGNILSKCDINEIDKYYSAEYSGMRELVQCSDDRFMLNFGNGLALFGKDGNMIDIDADDQYGTFDIALASDGRILCSQNNSYGFMKPDSAAIPADMTYAEELTGNFSPPVTGNGAFLVYFNLTGGLYGLTENGDIIEVINYDKSLISSTNGSIIPYGEDVFISSAGTNRIKIYTRRPDDYVEMRSPMDIWMIENGGTNIHELANEFCAINDNYLINIKEMVAYDDLPTAVLAGDGPDLIYYNNCSDMYNLVNLGALEDLDPYLDGDTGISKDDIMTNMVDALSYKGGIYLMPNMFSVNMMVAKKDFIGDEYKNLSISDFLEIYDSLTEGKTICYDDYMSSFLCSSDIWTDHEKGTCNYDSEEFIRILEICKDHEKNLSQVDYNDPESMKEYFNRFKDNKTIFKIVNYPTLDMIMRELGVGGMTLEDVTFLNIPGSGGGRIDFLNNYSILANSDCKEGAWEFISYAVGERKTETPYWLPIYKNSFKRYIELYIDPPEGRRTESTTVNDVPYTFEASASETDLKRYSDFIMSCNKMRYENRDIDDIFYEEYDRFFNDEITAEECARNLQGRIEIMLSEKS